MTGTRWRKGAALGAILTWVSTLGACSFEHAVRVDYDEWVTKSVDGQEVKGVIHVETWTPAFFYVLPLLGYQTPERAVELAEDKAQSIGADAITDIRLHVETHMPFFFLVGWIENHVSATAVEYK